jgi:hypothetical protein
MKVVVSRTPEIFCRVGMADPSDPLTPLRFGAPTKGEEAAKTPPTGSATGP